MNVLFIMKVRILLLLECLNDHTCLQFTLTIELCTQGVLYFKSGSHVCACPNFEPLYGI